MTNLPNSIDISSDVAKALANPHRLELLAHLRSGEASVEGLANLSRLSIANTSQHLQVLRRCGLVQVRRNGKHMLYTLGEGPVQLLMDALQAYSEDLSQRALQLAHESRAVPTSLPAVSWDELSSLLEGNSITLLDVRPAKEFALGHLPGAMNIPIEQLAQRQCELSADRDIVAYCRGPFCVLSDQAEAILKSNGYRVRKFTEGATVLDGASGNLGSSN